MITKQMPIKSNNDTYTVVRCCIFKKNIHYLCRRLGSQMANWNIDQFSNCWFFRHIFKSAKQVGTSNVNISTHGRFTCIRDWTHTNIQTLFQTCRGTLRPITLETTTWSVHKGCSSPRTRRPPHYLPCSLENPENLVHQDRLWVLNTLPGPPGPPVSIEHSTWFTRTSCKYWTFYLVHRDLL